MELGLPELLLAAVTVVTPIFNAIAIQSKWDSKTKNAVAFGVSLLLSAVYLFFTGGFADLSDIPGVVLAVYGLQQLVYKQFLQNLTKKIEAATDVGAGEAVIVEKDKSNVVVETGSEHGEVIIVDEEAETHPAPLLAEPVADPENPNQFRGNVVG